MNSSIIIAIIVIVIIIAGVAAYLTLGHHPATTSSTTSSATTTFLTSSTSNSVPPTSSSTSSTTSSSTTTTTQTATQTVTLPPGANVLPYNPNNKTVFIYLTVTVTGPSFNYNGTAYGQMKLYVPAGWNVMIILTNDQSIPHNANIVLNETPIPNNSNISADGKILLYVGDSPSNFMSNGVQPGQTVIGMLDNISAGYYWIACGIYGHAESGMWADLIVSSSVSVPYSIISSSTSSTSSTHSWG
ncbi:sulfocyanin [Saccharolobus solfataricus]|nr:sulfocyanin [Saccharolobus solfataricus]AKA74994.1 sulfocyanin [Saccharolobus solfataricus]AKA77687.1 sulfocyanin [Saccharolobus solfataricus]AKA80378.1 sulfocyanin [Saccharolobus solfataricus]AZF69456.1 sulfocyanin [Saccharolobus solfataricus]AZF72076.1 sulfocyanin [Saccharolobus solfataricus]